MNLLKKLVGKTPTRKSGVIGKVAVIGAGVMGAGIAAHIANAGIPVRLLDIVPPEPVPVKGAPKSKKPVAIDRNAIAKGAIEKLKKSNPAALMHPANAKLIMPGNTEDNLADLTDCDWVIEAVIEKLDIKRDLYKRLAKVFGKLGKGQHPIVSSNTSTIPLTTLLAGTPETFREQFLITHFFNPPRYLRLMEIVGGPDTKSSVLKTITTFADVQLGKSVVPCNDTPGFIANRIGTYWIHAAITKAMGHNITVEEADALLSRPIGVPKTGVFGLVDLVGLDLIPHVLNSLIGALPKRDPFHALGPAPALLMRMVAEGYTGRKGKGGFYRLNKDGGKKDKEVIDLAASNGGLIYRSSRKPRLAALEVSKKQGLRALVEHDSAHGRYVWEVLRDTLSYAAILVGEEKGSIAPDIERIDRAMRLGYNMQYGPFQLIDKLGTAWFAERLAAEGHDVPPILQAAKGRPLYRENKGRLEYLDLSGKYQPVPRADGVLLLEDVKRRGEPVFTNRSASVWDIGDGVACLEFHSKMNSLNPFILCLMNRALRTLPKKGFKAMVIYNEGANFSVGANIFMLKVLGMLRLFPLIRLVLHHGQRTFANIKKAPFPVVAAPANMALGGSCEIILHSHAVVAHAECYIGLVEAGVGIIPGWGGCTELLGRAIQNPKVGGGPMPPVVKTFETIGMAKVSKSAAEARDLMFLRPSDEIVMNRDRVLSAAKDRALAMAREYKNPAFKKPEPVSYVLPGDSGYAAVQLALHDLRMKDLATPHDMVVGGALGRILTGGKGADPTHPLTEDDMRELERDYFIRLTKTRATRARVSYMLKNGKPLRN